jgi:hypothetical protein
MKREDVAEVLARPYSQELPESSIPARLAYIGVDGEPRAIPIGFWWDGAHVVMATAPKSAKVRALRQNPRVALTIDTERQWPPKVLLLRGAARRASSWSTGCRTGYIQASRKALPVEHFESWEQGVRALYDQMVVSTIEPDWAKLLDFETTLPMAVEDLLARQGAAGGQDVRREV